MKSLFTLMLCTASMLAAEKPKRDQNEVALPSGAVARFGYAHLTHSDRVNCARFTPDGRFLVTGSHDRTIRFWNVKTGKEVKRFTGTSNYVSALAFDANQLLAAERGDGIFIWNWKDSGLIRQIPRKHFTDFVTISPDGRYVASLERDWNVHVRDAVSGKDAYFFKGQNGSSRAVAFSPDNRFLAYSKGDKIIRLVDLQTSKEVKTLHGHKGAITTLVFSPHAKHLFSGGKVFNQGTHVWDIKNAKVLKIFKDYERPRLSDDGKILALSNSSKMKLVDAKTFKTIRQFPDRTRYTDADFSPDGKILATVNQSNRARLWDVKTGKELLISSGHRSVVLALLFSRDGKSLISSAGDRTIRVWDLSTFRERRQIKSENTYFVALETDGKSLRAMGRNRRAYRWDLKTWKQEELQKGTLLQPSNASRTSDRRWKALAQPASVWILKVKQEKPTLKIPVSNVKCLDLSPDGHWLVTGGGRDAHALRVWEVPSGRLAFSFPRQQGRVYAVAFSPDGRLLASGGADRTVLLWKAEPPGFKMRKIDYSDARLTQFWSLLLEDNPSKAYESMRHLTAAGAKTIRFLQKHLKDDAQFQSKVNQWIDDLANDDFAKRDAAFRELKKLGTRAGQTLLKRSKSAKELQMRRQIDQLLALLKEKVVPLEKGIASGGELRQLRIISVLSRIATKEARALLKKLAKEAASLRCAEEAQAALKRLR